MREQALIKKYNDDAAKWNEHTTALNIENQRLAKWRNVADAETKAAEMVHYAEAVMEKARIDANNLLATAQQGAASLRAEADQKVALDLEQARQTASTLTSESRQKAKSLSEDAVAVLNSATIHAAQIIDRANKNAEKIGGSAYESLKNASLYEKAIKSMKRVIDGYGDQYIIPPQSLLDYLADDFSYTQAGQELKCVRECTKVMIRNGTAAACEYVEIARRDTAIHFIVDAFNGKVDSILSRVKQDGVGKLETQIRDAFELVNLNGKAFRDARITEEYLAARLEELKWGAISQQLATQMRDEQRHIKEQAREDARAEKEREQALREANKEEVMLRKALEQAQEQIEHATGEQKALYEARLEEMNERLKQALERKERARSMAEQTKRGCVYIISNIGSFGDDVYKIGLTRRLNPQDRIDELGNASVPFGFDVHARIQSDDAPALERKLQRRFLLNQMNKSNLRKEFFRISLTEIRDEIEKLGVTGVGWTMTAEAKQYQETLAMDASFKHNPASRDKWIQEKSHIDVIADDEDLEPVGATIEAD